MRVVGGKTGADGKLFAHIVWTVPGGPAEKGGLQQGDKILEWCSMSLVDRSFEEVCAIMDRTGEVAELLVEHAATDFRMCDLIEDSNTQGPSGSSGIVTVPTPSQSQRKNSDVTGLVAGKSIFICNFSFHSNFVKCFSSTLSISKNESFKFSIFNNFHLQTLINP